MAYTTINKHTDYFNTKLYTGTGSSNAITGVGHQPDFVWIKDRGATFSHTWTDSVRGTSKELYSNGTSAQVVYSQGVTSFDSDGFTLGTDGGVNSNGGSKVSWNWKAGGSASSNSDGDVTASLSANATAGFSISTFTTPSSGTFTVGHGLGVAPKFIVYRPVTASGWQIGHDSLGWTNFLTFSTAAPASNTAFGNTAPTTSVWTGNVANVGANASCVAYCFAEKTGYCKIGKFQGNSSNNFIYTGFAPSVVIAKSNAVDWWSIQDNKRPGCNTVQLLFPESSGTESSGVSTSLLSNGFEANTTNTGFNNSSYVTYYIAFGQSLVGSNNVPCTAR